MSGKDPKTFRYAAAVPERNTAWSTKQTFMILTDRSALVSDPSVQRLSTSS